MVEISTADSAHLLDLFARVLASGTKHLLKRGLDRGYIGTSEDLRVVRGRIDLNGSIKRGLLPVSRLACDFDEMSYDVIHNRILKTTISLLRRHSKLAPENHEALSQVSKRLHDIHQIQLESSLFSRIQLHRNNAFYGFLMSICQLIYHNVLAKEGDGDYLFKDFTRNSQQMGTLFEQFVLNFLKLEVQPNIKGCKIVGSERIDWDVAPDEEANTQLPAMYTDISIRWPDRYQIIDTKFYSRTFQTYYDKETIHSGNLYQLFTYLKQAEKKGPLYRNSEGMLLYPTVTKEVNLDFETQGHLVKVRTVNLNQSWQAIHQRLLCIAGVEANYSQ